MHLHQTMQDASDPTSLRRRTAAHVVYPIDLFTISSTTAPNTPKRDFLPAATGRETMSPRCTTSTISIAHSSSLISYKSRGPPSCLYNGQQSPSTRDDCADPPRPSIVQLAAATHGWKPPPPPPNSRCLFSLHMDTRYLNCLMCLRCHLCEGATYIPSLYNPGLPTFTYKYGDVP
jgi:hypothetical protein